MPQATALLNNSRLVALPSILSNTLSNPVLKMVYHSMFQCIKFSSVQHSSFHFNSITIVSSPRHSVK